MKKKIIIIGVAIAVIILGIIVTNVLLGFDEKDFKESLIEYIQPQLDEYKSEYGWTDVQVDVDLSGIDVVSERAITQSASWIDGEVGFILNVKEINEAVKNEDYSFELAQQIDSVSFDLDDFEDKKYSGLFWINPKDVAYVDSEGNSIYADAYYTGSSVIKVNGEEVFSTEAEVEEYKGNSGAGGSGHSGEKRCKKCGSWVKYTAANGYCKSCVDIYNNEWYVGIDGNVYVDRGY